MNVGWFLTEHAVDVTLPEMKETFPGKHGRGDEKERGMMDLDRTRKPNYPIESVDNALKLLLLFAEQQAISVSEASRAIGVAPSTAHRLLSMLQYYDFVSQNPTTRSYEAGPTLLNLGLAVVREMDIRRLARPFMEALRSEVGETVHLTILQGKNVLFIETIESFQALRVGDRTGISLPAHCTASGKALLAELPLERLHELFPDEQLVGLTAHSLTNREVLERELSQVRERGYATNFDESEPDVSAISAAIHDRLSRLRASLTVSAPSTRLQKDLVDQIAAATMRTAAAIEERLA
jgi:DNA-binding IclR family transcriptional regulator